MNNALNGFYHRTVIKAMQSVRVQKGAGWQRRIKKYEI